MILKHFIIFVKKRLLLDLLENLQSSIKFIYWIDNVQAYIYLRLDTTISIINKSKVN